MKQVRVVKWLLFAFVVLLMPTAWADILPPPEPLRRIGYEILVEVAAAAAGGVFVLRHLAGMAWKTPEKVSQSELSEWETQLEEALPELQKKFDETYKGKSKEWLVEDAKLAKIARARRASEENHLDLGRILRYILHPIQYRRELAVKRLEDKFREKDYFWFRSVNNGWRSLCHDLLFSLLEKDDLLRAKLRGVPIELLSDKMAIPEAPAEYCGEYRKDGCGLNSSEIQAVVDSLQKSTAGVAGECRPRIKASEIARKLDEVRPRLRAAFRKAYEGEQGYLYADWRQNLILSVLEGNDFLKKECLDVPIENLLTELMLEMRDNLKSRLAAVLPEARRAFDERYDTMAAEWLKKDEEAYKRTECYRKKCELSSLSGIIKGIFIPGYRRKSKRVISEYEKQVEFLPSRWKLGAPDPWLSLCESLADDILAEDKALKMKCRGVEYDALVSAVTRPHQPDGYKKGYKGEYTIQRRSTKGNENRT